MALLLLVQLITIVITVFTANISTSAAVSGNSRPSRYHAALCISRRDKCKPWLASTSGVCSPLTAALEQPVQCVQTACEWCILPEHQNRTLCKNKSLTNICNSSISNNTGTGCTFTGKNAMVVPMSEMRPAKGWEPVEREGLSGFVYKPAKNHGIDKPHRSTAMCAAVRAPASGSYYMTAISHAPHFTEHNDAWFRCSMGINLWRHNVFWRRATGRQWLKGFQNTGPRRFGTELKTRNNRGHRFIVSGVQRGDDFKVCVSGRSYRYEIYRLVLIPCKGLYCTGRMMTGVDKLAPSKCEQME